MLSTNCAESMNSVMKKSRSLPICAMVEATRKKCSEYFYKRHCSSAQWDTTLTPNKEDVLEKNLKRSRWLAVHRCSEFEFQIQGEDSCDVVNLERWSCTCRDWDVRGIPCKHALVAITSARKEIYDYCDQYFKTVNYRAAYDDFVRPMRGREYWIRLETDAIVYPPLAQLQAGRRKTTLKESKDNGKKKRKCSSCGALGHNKCTCRYAPVSTIPCI